MKITDPDMMKELKKHSQPKHPSIGDAEYEAALAAVMDFMNSPVMSRYKWLWKNDEIDHFINECENWPDEQVLAGTIGVTKKQWACFFDGNKISIDSTLYDVLITRDIQRMYQDISNSKVAVEFYRNAEWAATMISLVNTAYLLLDPDTAKDSQLLVAMSLRKINDIEPRFQRDSYFDPFTLSFKIKKLWQMYSDPEDSDDEQSAFVDNSGLPDETTVSYDDYDFNENDFTDLF